MIRAHMGKDGALFFHASGPHAPEQTRALMAQLQQLLPGGATTRTALIGGQLVHLRVDAGPCQPSAAVVPPIDRAGETSPEAMTTCPMVRSANEPEGGT